MTDYDREMRCYRDTISLIKQAEARQPRPIVCLKAVSLVPDEYPQVVAEADPSKIRGVPFELQGPLDHRTTSKKLAHRLEGHTEQPMLARNAMSELSLARYQALPRNNSVDLKKALGRDEVKSFLNVVPSEGRFARSYNPSYKTVEKRLDQLCLPFGKSVGRDFSLKYEERSPYSEVLDHLVQNQGRRMLHRRYSMLSRLESKGFVLSYEKALPRADETEKTLPLFMQRTNHSRFFANNVKRELFDANTELTSTKHSLAAPWTARRAEEESFDEFFDMGDNK